MMADRYVWVTTRQLTPGTLEEFERAWRPERHPDGMVRAVACWSEDAERHRRQAMSAYVEQENEAFYKGRELRIP
jgi:hypothetical protein